MNIFNAALYIFGFLTALVALTQMWIIVLRPCKRPDADVPADQPQDQDADADADADPEIEEMLEKFIETSEDLFYDKLRKEVEIYRQQLITQAAVSAKEAAMIEADLAAHQEESESQKPRRRRNRSF
jgi:hypothetical protein